MENFSNFSSLIYATSSEEFQVVRGHPMSSMTKQGERAKSFCALLAVIKVTSFSQWYVTSDALQRSTISAWLLCGT